MRLEPDRFHTLCLAVPGGVYRAGSSRGVFAAQADKAGNPAHFVRNGGGDHAGGEPAGKLAFVPAAAGFSIGIVFLWVLDKLIPHLHMGSDTPEGPKSNLKKTTMLVFAVTLHNLPEGMVVGLAAALALHGDADAVSGALALSLGIGLQNIPEGAAVSLPLTQSGRTRGQSFAAGAASGLVEPLGAVLAFVLAEWVGAALPWLMSAAAGCMVCVTAQEMIPEAVEPDEVAGVISIVLGFALMMALDVAL